MSQVSQRKHMHGSAPSLHLSIWIHGSQLPLGDRWAPPTAAQRAWECLEMSPQWNFHIQHECSLQQGSHSGSRGNQTHLRQMWAYKMVERYLKVSSPLRTFSIKKRNKIWEWTFGCSSAVPGWSLGAAWVCFCIKKVKDEIGTKKA